LIFLARLTAVIGFFLGGWGGWQRAPYEVRTTHGGDGEFDGGGGGDDDDDDDDDDEVVAGRSDRGKVGLENMCFSFAQIIIVVHLVHCLIAVPLVKTRLIHTYNIQTTLLLQHISTFERVIFREYDRYIFTARSTKCVPDVLVKCSLLSNVCYDKVY